jgi:type I restriction enzyme R subunit
MPFPTIAANLRKRPRPQLHGFKGSERRLHFSDRSPLFKDDEITRRVFGEYVSTYDFQRAVEDGATVALFYDARGDKLGIETTDLNLKIADAIEHAEIDDVNVEQRLEAELKRDYHIITAQKRLEQVAKDFVRHYSTSWESGKAMFICIDKVTCVRLYNLIIPAWADRIRELETELTTITDEQEVQFRERQIAWMRETLTAVVVSEEQGEVDRFRKWDVDIKPHRKLLKDGFALADGTRIDVETAFKREDHQFRVAIVCAMWLTGFDVPSLGTLYLDKPLKAHTLMQAIARANRVNEGKENGLIVDYCGILKNLRKALATFAGTHDTGHGGTTGSEDPAQPEEELLDGLKEAILLVRSFLKERGALLDDIINQTGFARNAAIIKAKEAANENDETRKRFEVMCREVFNKFRACITMDGVNEYRHDRDAVNIIYKSLQDDREQADISDIIRELHKVVEGAITTKDTTGQASVVYDISKIDFERLRQEFEHTPAPHTTVQNLKHVIEQRLQRLMAQNPLRTNFQAHYEEIVHEYNQEKDRVTIEHTFEQLLRFVQELNEEEARAIREGLDVESVVIYDLLQKPALDAKEIARIKQVAVELLATLKAEKLRVNQWRDKEATRDAVRSTIFDFLYSDNTGLPAAYTDDEIKTKADAIFQHVFYAYPTIPSPIYGAAADAR